MDHSFFGFSVTAANVMRTFNEQGEHASRAAKIRREEGNNEVRSLCFLSGKIPFRPMNKTVIQVQVRAVLPTSGGCAVFLGNTDKVFIIYVDQTVGSAITMFMRDVSKERPLTHDLLAHLMTALGAHVERIIINDLKNATYYARMIIRAENELSQKKIVELDGRPSDCIAMAVQQKAPIYVSQEVWDEVDDMSDVLRKMEEEGLNPESETESESESSEEDE
jgi:uncharacterized protein